MQKVIFEKRDVNGVVTNKKFILVFITFIFFFSSFTLAFNFPDSTTITTILGGNITDTNASTACSGTDYLAGNGSCLDPGTIGGDTNETTRFNALVATDCAGTNKVTGVQANGTIVCEADEGGTDTTILAPNQYNTTQFNEDSSQLNIILSWLNSHIDSWFTGKTTDDLTQGSTNLYDNKSFNQSLTNTLYEPAGITESDISDLSHTVDTDTNASTACSGTTTYLDGEGNCDDISGVYLTSYTETDPHWSGNQTNVAFTNVEETFSGNVTVEGIKLEGDTTNHRIYDNSTCVIIRGDTSVLEIC